MKHAFISAAFVSCLSLACGREQLKMPSKVPTTNTTPTAAVPSSTPRTPEAAPAEPVKIGPITDSHIHLWTLPRSQPPMSDDGRFPGASPAWIAVNAMLPDYERTQGGQWVDRSVVIESISGVPPSKRVAANQWMLDQVKSQPKLLSVVGGLDVLQSPLKFKRELDQLASDKHFVGLRVSGGDLLEGGQLKANALANLRDLAARGMMVDSLDTSGNDVAAIAKAVPSLRIVIDHLAQKSFDFEVPADWHSRLEAASAQPNVYLKISDTGRLNQGSQGGDGWSNPYPSASDPKQYRAVFEAVWALFGEDRLLFGSNWPVSNVAGDFRTQIVVLEAFLKGKGRAARDKVMSGNAAKLYGPRP